MKKESVKSLNEISSKYGVEEKELKNFVNKELKKSKSKVMIGLNVKYEMSISDVRDVINNIVSDEDKVSYNFCYNRISKGGGKVIKNSKGESKKKVIEELYKEGYGVKDILVNMIRDKGMNVSENYIRNVLRELKE